MYIFNGRNTILWLYIFNWHIQIYYLLNIYLIDIYIQIYGCTSLIDNTIILLYIFNWYIILLLYIFK